MQIESPVSVFVLMPLYIPTTVASVARCPRVCGETRGCALQHTVLRQTCLTVGNLAPYMWFLEGFVQHHHQAMCMLAVKLTLVKGQVPDASRQLEHSVWVSSLHDVPQITLANWHFLGCYHDCAMGL